MAGPIMPAAAARLVADQVAHLAHLNARDTTLVFASRAPQADIARLKARMGWEMPGTHHRQLRRDFGVDEWHGHNVFIRDGDRVFRTYFINSRGDEAMGTHLELSRHHGARPPGKWEDSPEGYPQTPPYKWWNWHDNYEAEAAPDQNGSKCPMPAKSRCGNRRADGQGRGHEFSEQNSADAGPRRQWPR